MPDAPVQPHEQSLEPGLKQAQVEVTLKAQRVGAGRHIAPGARASTFETNMAEFKSEMAEFESEFSALQHSACEPEHATVMLRDRSSGKVPYNCGNLEAAQSSPSKGEAASQSKPCSGGDEPKPEPKPKPTQPHIARRPLSYFLVGL